MTTQDKDHIASPAEQAELLVAIVRKHGWAPVIKRPFGDIPAYVRELYAVNPGADITLLSSWDASVGYQSAQDGREYLEMLEDGLPIPPKAATQPAPTQPAIAQRDITAERMLDRINIAMNGTTSCRGFTLGECAMIDHLKTARDGRQIYVAALFLWDQTFNDSAAIAKWFSDAGAESITVQHTLFDEINGDRDGKTEDGARAIEVTFLMKDEASI